MISFPNIPKTLVSHVTWIQRVKYIDRKVSHMTKAIDKKNHILYTTQQMICYLWSCKLEAVYVCPTMSQHKNKMDLAFTFTPTYDCHLYLHIFAFASMYEWHVYLHKFSICPFYWWSLILFLFYCGWFLCYIVCIIWIFLEQILFIDCLYSLSGN